MGLVHLRSFLTFTRALCTSDPEENACCLVDCAVICEITVNFISLIIFCTEEGNLISALSYFLNFCPEKKSQNSRVVEVGRHLWRSKQGQAEQVF